MSRHIRACIEIPDNLASLSRIDLICDQFECDWQAGGQSDFAPLLEQAPANERPRLFLELLLVEWELRSRGAAPLEWDEYRARYPQYADQVEYAQFMLAADKPVESRNGLVISDQSSRRIAHFNLVEKIGQGAGAEVWKAWDCRLQRTVAIKLSHVCCPRADDWDRFLREGRAAGQLNHPGIVAIYEVGRELDCFYLVSEYIAGEDLRVWLKRLRPSLPQTADICRQIAAALHHAHEQGVVHRDLKPANVLVDQQGRAYITDFGLARWPFDVHEHCSLGQWVGTPAYMSPEQARGESPLANARSDIYALGVLLYEMLTGRRPLASEQHASDSEASNELLLSPRAIDSTISPELETICLRALRKNPEDRYRTALEMADDLGRCQRRLAAMMENNGSCAGGVRRAWLFDLIAVAALVLMAVGSLLATSFSSSIRATAVGQKRVVLTSVPGGARVALVPLNPFDGEPLADQVVRPPGRTPLVVRLKPGDYLVVAALDERRFHEVHRRVPADDLAAQGEFNHQRWEPRADRKVALPAIVIPQHDVTEEMALVTEPMAKTAKQFRPGPILMDCLEVTAGDYREFFREDVPGAKWRRETASDAALSVSFDQAMAIAEAMGKRLPSSAEYQRAMRCLYPVDPDDELAAHAACRFGPVGSLGHDCTDTLPPIFGLCSNVAEWTSTRAAPVSRGSLDCCLHSQGSPEFRIARGGMLNVINFDLSSSEPATSHEAFGVPVMTTTLIPGLGFRCARSVRPRFLEIGSP